MYCMYHSFECRLHITVDMVAILQRRFWLNIFRAHIIQHHVCTCLQCLSLLHFSSFKFSDKWDGCTYNPQIQGLFGPNVDGLGYVDQVLT